MFLGTVRDVGKMSQAEQSSGLVCRHFLGIINNGRFLNDLNDWLSIGFVHNVLEFNMKVKSKWFQLVQPV